MKFISTRGGEKICDAQAILQGFGVDGGLFAPEKIPVVSKEEFFLIIRGSLQMIEVDCASQGS